jgi:hypothetical protein
MAVLIKHLALRHQDRLGIAGALTEAAPHDAQKRFDNLHFTIFFLVKHIFGTDLQTFPASIA